MHGKQAVVGAVGARSGPRAGWWAIGRVSAALGGAVGRWAGLVAALQPSVRDK